MDAVSNQYRVRTCSECLGDAYYFCKSSGCDICTECSKEYENKNYAYKTKARDLILYRERLTIHPFQETCMRHSENVYENCCKLCEFPFCSHCTEHRMHGQTDLKTAYDTKRQQNENIVNLEKIYYRNAFYLYIQVLLLKSTVVNIIETNSLIYRKKPKDLSNTLRLFCVVLKYSTVVLNRVLFLLTCF